MAVTWSPAGERWAWAEVDLDAVVHNVAVLRAAVSPAAVWAVVKADGYGHGAVEVARAALDAGAGGLCVALVQEAARLRAAGIDAPILVLSEQPPDQLADAVRLGVVSTVCSTAQLDALEAAGAATHRVHLKVDTGMHRVGCPPEQAVALAQSIERRPALVLDGVFTHLAVADEPADPFTARQLARFDTVLSELAAAGIDPGRRHAANSAGALAHPRARLDLVRVGIAAYGVEPGRGVEHLCRELRPAMSLRARVSHVKPVAAGERISYGLRHAFAHDTVVATVPIGYADGVPRRLFETHGEVLVGSRRCPIVGVVTMDQLMVDVGHGADVRVGDRVTLLGADGDERIRPEDWAERLGTIGYEVVCGISARVARHHSRRGVVDSRS
ncbi:MAG: alanine racemase [Acidimicrobiaceae bacterium]|nr:alanine racemase [Acidimicrobiaceae bacterium]